MITCSYPPTVFAFRISIYVYPFVYLCYREFPLRLENPHVISPSQISVSVVKQGPESVTLNSNYQNRYC